MKYSITRKINLGRYGFQYEAVDLGVSECATRKEAMDEIRVWKQMIINEIRETKKEEELEKKRAKEKTSKEDLPF